MYRDPLAGPIIHNSGICDSCAG